MRRWQRMDRTWWQGFRWIKVNEIVSPQGLKSADDLRRDGNRATDDEGPRSKYRVEVQLMSVQKHCVRVPVLQHNRQVSI